MGLPSGGTRTVGLFRAIEKVVFESGLRALFAGALASNAFEIRTFKVPILLAWKPPRLDRFRNVPAPWCQFGIDRLVMTIEQLHSMTIAQVDIVGAVHTVAARAAFNIDSIACRARAIAGMQKGSAVGHRICKVMQSRPLA